MKQGGKEKNTGEEKKNENKRKKQQHTNWEDTICQSPNTARQVSFLSTAYTLIISSYGLPLIIFTQKILPKVYNL